MRFPVQAVALVWLFTSAVTSAGVILNATPESFSSLGEKLGRDANINEVVFSDGVYSGGLIVSGPKDGDFAGRPLLIRAADGANVLFDGAKAVEKFQPHEELSGVFSIDYTHRGGEYPKFWEPRTRIRYRLVADRQSVARFPATFTVEKDRLLFHTSDGKTPRDGELLMSAEDNGLFINRPHVTVRGIAFQNFLARDKWSTGIDLRADNITVEDCITTNASHGFIITGKNSTLRRCKVEDVGGGVYVGGENATVEACWFYKRRDTFMVPMYAQDDTGIQYYVPAR